NNWSPNTGFPAAGDTAIFGNPTGSYTVTFAGGVTNTGARVTQGWPTFSLTFRQAYTVSGLNGFILGSVAGQTGKLTTYGGGTLSLTAGNSLPGGIGATTFATGNLFVSGAGTTFTTNGNYCDIGVSGTGTLTILDGASASLASSYVGSAAAGNGTITVTGTGS